MKAKQSALSALFGTSNSDRFANLLKQLSAVLIECSAHFRQTSGRNLAGIIELEHKADAIVDDIHELLDNSFIMRFDIPDSMKLTDELDNVIDGMRKVAIHLDVYKIHLTQLRTEATELIQLGDSMVQELNNLVLMLGEPRLNLPKAREIARSIDASEAKADKIVSDVERQLVMEFSQPSMNSIGFIAWHQLFHLLEQMTDDANRCAKLIVSLARKEA